MKYRERTDRILREREKGLKLNRDTRPTDLVGSRTPTPIETVSLPVPTDYRIRLHDDKTRVAYQKVVAKQSGKAAISFRLWVVLIQKLALALAPAQATQKR
jgi:hypothetical protein